MEIEEDGYPTEKEILDLTKRVLRQRVPEKMLRLNRAMFERVTLVQSFLLGNLEITGLGSIKTGWRAFLPLTDDFIKRPTGELEGEYIQVMR